MYSSYVPSCVPTYLLYIGKWTVLLLSVFFNFESIFISYCCHLLNLKLKMPLVCSHLKSNKTVVNKNPSKSFLSVNLVINVFNILLKINLLN